MSKVEQYSRLIHHRSTISGQAFTVPTSNDHTDETWLATDLYVGEIGLNVTDDTIYMRTNNGIIQISASSSGGGTQGAVFIYSSPNIEIGSTYSADAVTPRTGYYTDLGSSTLRWKDLYLGGSSNGICGINVNAGLLITQASTVGILTSGFAPVDNSPIVMGYGTVSSAVVRDRELFLNSKDVYMQGTGNQRVMIASNGVIMGTASDILVSGQNVTINTGVGSHVHLGYGYNRTNYNSYEVVAGGALAVRGVADDGSTQYNRSDWTTTQDLLRTTNANTTNIATIPWGVTGIGNVMLVKAYLTGTKITDSTMVYSSEIFGCYNLEPTGLSASTVGTPIINELSSFGTVPPSCEMDADANAVYIKVKGTTDTIQWLVSYSYHQLINIV